MSSFHPPIDPHHGAIADVTIGASASARSAGLATATQTFRALFDTGADSTIVDEGVPDLVGIQPYDAIDVFGIHSTPVRAKVYRVDLSFPGDKGLVVPNLSVAELPLRHSSAGTKANVRILIGRSVLGRGKFVYDGWNRAFTFELAPSKG